MSPVMETDRSRKGREVLVVFQMNFRAGWKFMVKLIKSMSSARVQEVAPMQSPI